MHLFIKNYMFCQTFQQCSHLIKIASHCAQRGRDINPELKLPYSPQI